MSELKRLIQEYDIRVKDLQEHCTHTDITEWVRQQEYGKEYCTKTCKRCGKLIDEKLFNELPEEQQFLMSCSDVEKMEVFDIMEQLGIDRQLAARLYMANRNKKG